MIALASKAEAVKENNKMIALALKDKNIKDEIATIAAGEEKIKMIVACSVFAMLAGIYLFNATNGEGSDMPTELLVAAASLIVGYYFRGKR
jgi:hypothetical protein